MNFTFHFLSVLTNVNAGILEVEDVADSAE